jgi:hypothetical protein
MWYIGEKIDVSSWSEQIGRLVTYFSRNSMHFVEAYICRSFITCRCDYLKTIIQVEYSIYQIYSILQYSTVELLHLNQFNEKFLKLLCTLSKLIEIFTRLSGVDHIGLVVNVYLSAGPKLCRTFHIPST